MLEIIIWLWNSNEGSLNKNILLDPQKFIFSILELKTRLFSENFIENNDDGVYKKKFIKLFFSYGSCNFSNFSYLFKKKRKILKHWKTGNRVIKNWFSFICWFRTWRWGLNLWAWSNKSKCSNIKDKITTNYVCFFFFNL